MSKELNEKELIKWIKELRDVMSELLDIASQARLCKGVKPLSKKDNQIFDQLIKIVEEHIVLKDKKLTIPDKWIEDLAEFCFDVIDMGGNCGVIIEHAIKELGFTIIGKKGGG